MPILIAAIFIGWYFYRSATNIGKNGFLWVGIALAIFVFAGATGVLGIALSAKVIFDANIGDGMALGVYAGLFTSVIGLFITNHFLNKVYD